MADDDPNGEPVCVPFGTGVTEVDGELGGVEVGGGLDGDDEVGDELGDGEVDDELGAGEVGVGELALDDAELDWYGAVGAVLGAGHHDAVPDGSCDAAGIVPMTRLEVWAGAIDWLTPGAGTTGGSPAAELWCVPFPAVPPGAAHPVAPLADALADVGFPAFVVFSPLAPLEYALPPPVPPGPLPPL